MVRQYFLLRLYRRLFSTQSDESDRFNRDEYHKYTANINQNSMKTRTTIFDTHTSVDK